MVSPIMMVVTELRVRVRVRSVRMTLIDSLKMMRSIMMRIMIRRMRMYRMRIMGGDSGGGCGGGDDDDSDGAGAFNCRNGGKGVQQDFGSIFTRFICWRYVDVGT
jgi:hypothetical protein